MLVIINCSFFKCRAFLTCPSFYLIWLCGRCPLYLPLGRLHVCLLRGAGQISICCSHTWNLSNSLEIWPWKVRPSVLYISSYSQGRLVGIYYPCRTYFGHSHFSLPGRRLSVVLSVVNVTLILVFLSSFVIIVFLSQYRYIPPPLFLSVVFMLFLFTEPVEGRNIVFVVNQICCTVIFLSVDLRESVYMSSSLVCDQ